MNARFAILLSNVTGTYVPITIADSTEPPALTREQSELLSDLLFCAQTPQVVRMLRFCREQATAVHSGKKSETATDDEIRASKAKVEAMTEIGTAMIRTIADLEAIAEARERWLKGERPDTAPPGV